MISLISVFFHLRLVLALTGNMFLSVVPSILCVFGKVSCGKCRGNLCWFWCVREFKLVFKLFFYVACFAISTLVVPVAHTDLISLQFMVFIVNIFFIFCSFWLFFFLILSSVVFFYYCLFSPITGHCFDPCHECQVFLISLVLSLYFQEKKYGC